MDRTDLDDKERSSHIEDGSPHRASIASHRVGMEPPELVKAMSADERVSFEKHLVRKIDLRLMPAGRPHHSNYIENQAK